MKRRGLIPNLCLGLNLLSLKYFVKLRKDYVLCCIFSGKYAKGAVCFCLDTGLDKNMVEGYLYFSR